MQKVEATVSIGCREVTRKKWWHVAVALAAVGTLSLSGCAKNEDSSGPTTSTTAASAGKVDAIANTVPEAIKSSGKLIVGVNVPYTPNEFKDPSGKIIGSTST